MKSTNLDGERLEIALRGDEHFRSLADTAPAMLWVTEPEGACSFLSRGWYDFTGQTEDIALGSGWLDAVHPDDRVAAETTFAAAGEKRNAFTLEYRLKRHDGAYRWAIDSARPRFGADGEFLGYVGLVVDITARKRTELLDQEQKKVLERIAAGRPIEECLRGLTEAVGRLAPSAVGNGIVIEPSARASLDELAVFHPPALAQALRHELFDEQTCHSIPVLVAGQPIASFRLWLAEPRALIDWERRVVELGAHVAGIALERERTSVALRERDARFRGAADAAKTAVYDIVVDDGVADTADVYGLEHIVGRPPNHPLTAAWWRSRIHPADVSVHEATVARSTADSTCSEYQSEYRVMHADGSWRNVEDRAHIRRARDGGAVRIVGTIQDVTPRKRSELELRRNREQLELLSDSVPALISYVGSDRCYRTCNAEYSKWFGLPREVIAGRPMRDVLGAKAWQVVGPHIERAFGGELSEYEAEVDYRHGGTRWIHARYVPHRDEAGAVVGVVCLVTDITARRLAGDARARLAAIVDSSDDAIVSKSLDGTIMSWNAGAARLFGYGAGEAVGQPITMLIPDGRHEEEQRILARVRGGQAVKPYETVRLRKDGSLLDVSLSVSPIIDESGRIVGASKIARDITARKRAERDLRQSREALDGLVERAPFGIYIVDAQLKVVQMNDRSQSGAFHNVRPIIGRDLEEITRVMWPEPVATQIMAAFRHTLDTGEPYRSHNFISQRADTVHVESYEWELHRITLPDSNLGVVCYYFDSTRLREAEQSLREADRRKDEFLATLAHELRNPLAPIHSGLQILHMAGTDRSAAAQVLQMLDRQVNHLVRLVDDLMEVARVTRGRIELRKELVDLGALLVTAVETSRPLIEAARHELTVNVPAEPVTVLADSVRLAQIVANLLNNAAKYTETGGHISLSANREGDQAVISVRDTGMGIPVDVLPRVFDLFSQGDRTYQRGQGGLGIGLTLVRTLVELHGGSVAAASEGPGRGSEFIVRLPLSADGEQRREDSSVEREAIFKSQRFLVVDDNRDAAESLTVLLRGLGAAVATAGDGRGALDALEAYRPSVLLLDIGMPGMDGLEVARRVRQQPNGRALTVIALSGWGQDEDRRRSREAGIDYHLVKPVDLDELARLLMAPRAA
jgi:PAS domain S-box-containing protein